MRQGDWKLIRRFFGNLDHKPDQSDTYELYNLRDDMGESHNLAAAQPDKVRELDAALSRYLRDTGAVLPVKNPNTIGKPRSRARNTDEAIQIPHAGSILASNTAHRVPHNVDAAPVNRDFPFNCLHKIERQRKVPASK